MKSKRITVLTAVLLLIAAFSFSLNAYAVKGGKAKKPSASKPKTTQTTQPTEATEPPAVPALQPGAFTPNGQGSVLDYVENNEDEKSFYTITTPSGSVFYLVVDEARDGQNVYFLNAVTESDLMALAEKNEDITIDPVPNSPSCICSEKCKDGKVNENCPVCKSDAGKCSGGRSSTSDEASEKGSDKKNDSGTSDFLMYGIIAAAFVVVAGIGVYAKIIRPKKQQPTFDDEDESDGYGENYGADEYGSPEYLPEDDTDTE